MDLCHFEIKNILGEFMKTLKTKFNVTSVLAIVALLALLCVFVQVFNLSSASAAVVSEYKEGLPESGYLMEKKESVSDFVSKGQTVAGQTELQDFEGNKFMLYELAPIGYAIYSLKNDARVFIEGAYSSNSPFYGYEDKEKIYLGFGEYYYKQDNEYVNILSGESFEKEDLATGFYLQDEAYYEKTSRPMAVKSTATNTGKTVNEGGFTKIGNHSYFETLKKFPRNTKGTCSLVALSIMIGYLDMYVNNGFIPENASYNGKPFRDENGTSQALHDYLFDKCLHTVLGLSSEEGYPMANAEIKKSMQDYLNGICGKDFAKRVNCISGSLFNTHKNPRKYIDQGYPVILTMTSYKSSITSGKQSYHTVVAYGYNKDKDTFLVHIGWKPGSLDGTKVVISDATIYSYNTFKY